MAQFLVKAGQPDLLANAPGGQKYLTTDAATLDRGKRVFAETCARCHSSKLPDEARAKLAPGGCSGPDYLTCFKRYWALWDNFSSETYKTLPSVGKITLQDPFTAERWRFQMPGGGLGFTRVPSLVSVWSSAPFLLNNRLGPFSDDPSVDGRMKIFDASIEQLLWPEKREREPGFDGYIVRTTERSYVNIPKRSVPVEPRI